MSNPTARRPHESSDFHPAQQARAGVSSKIKGEHLSLGAALYIRQSTSHQLRENRESTARQYALQDRLVALGWSADHIVVIDDDLGISGNGKAERPGFRRLLKLVTDQQVGIVLGLEMSRLARNSKDWQDLFEVCAIFGALIADEDGVFDPHDPNDRLVLGLKGIISEMELHTMKVRLERGRLSKAQRGELFQDVPVGYVLDEAGLPRLDPDESARHVMKLFFDLFESLGSSNALFHYLVTHNIKLPFRDRGGCIDWRLPAKTTVYQTLKHPLYAGAYSYGRGKNYKLPHGTGKKKHLPPEQWKVWIKDRHPAYITWDQYGSNQRRLTQNDARGGDRSGPIRGGSALLGGIVFCGNCNWRMSPHYSSSGPSLYFCRRHDSVALAASCHNSIRCETLDELVAGKLLEVLAPAGLELTLQVIEDEVARREQLDALHANRVEQARYAKDLAERRYKEVDPANRLVAHVLEQEWETALADLQVVNQHLEQFRLAQSVQLSDGERQFLTATCAQVDALWRDRASIEERKQITRLLLRRVEVQVHNNSDRVGVTIQWSGGFESCHEITRTVMRFDQLESYQGLVDRALGLALAGKSYPQIAAVLEAELFRSPRTGRPISAGMLQNLLSNEPHCRQQLNNPSLEPGHWRSADLAKEIGVSEKRLKQWVTLGWAMAIQRPQGRTWVIYADEPELKRLQQLHRSQSGQGRSAPQEKLRTPAPISRKNP